MTKTILSAIIIAFVAGSIMTGTIEAKKDEKNDKNSFQAVWNAIADLQTQIDELGSSDSSEIKHYTTTEAGIFFTIIDPDVTLDSVISLSVNEVLPGDTPSSGCASATVREGSFTIACFYDQLEPGSTFNYFITNP